MPQIEHRHNWRNAVCIALVAFCVSAARAQLPAAVGPVRLSISPANPAAIPNGKSLKLAVLENFFRSGSQSTGVRDISSHVTAWTSSDPTTISVGSRGLAIAHQPSGTAVITATVRAPGWPGQISITLSAAPAVLQFISLAPFDSSVAVSGNRTYTATGHYSDSTTADLTGTATWAVVNSIGGTGGQATNTGATVTGSAAGIVKVTATDNASGIVGATYLNVGLTGITVSPTNPSVPKGNNQLFTATGTFSSGPSADITNSVVWVSQNTTVARMTVGLPACGTCPPGGIASTFALGSAGIYAFSGSVSSAVPAQTLTVTAPVVTSVVIAPSGGCSPGSVPRGNSCQFTAEAIYSDHSTAVVTDSAVWNSSDLTCVAISATGLATTLNPPVNPPFPCAGSVNISASFSSVTSNTIALTVTAHLLTSISISPKNPTQPKGTSQQFTVKAHYTDGTVTVANGGAGSPVWASSNTSVATIGSSTGLASTTNSTTGTTNIGATYSNLQASTVFTVTAAALASITVTPVGRVPLTPDDGSTTIPIAGTQQFLATGNYTDNTHQDITGTVNWTSSSGAATINDPDAPGEATGIAAGAAITITATDPNSGINGSALLTVNTISSITLAPPSASLGPGATQTFTATAHYGGTTQPLTAFAPIWSSTANNVATVDQSGQATAVAQGSATIKAQLGSVVCVGVSCGAITVNPAVLQTITVACDPNAPCTNSGEPVLQLGQTEQMIATGNYSDGSTQDLTQTTGLTWASTNTGVATIDTKGFLTTKGFGSTNITATCLSGGGCPGATSTVQGSLSLTVTF